MWPFSKVHGIPIKRPYFGTCAQAICERRTIISSNLTTETNFDPSWRAACTEFSFRSVQSAPVFGFDGRPLGTFVTASRRSRHPFDHDMTGLGVYALRTILEKELDRGAWKRTITTSPTSKAVAGHHALVASGNGSNAVIVHTIFSSASSAGVIPRSSASLRKNRSEGDHHSFRLLFVVVISTGAPGLSPSTKLTKSRP